MIPASRIADAAYIGSVTDTSELSGVLTEAMQDKHPYLPKKTIQDAISRIQDTLGLDDTYSSMGLNVLSGSDKPGDSCPWQYITQHLIASFTP